MLCANGLVPAGDRDLGSLAQQRGVFAPKYFGAETHGCVQLGLPEAAIRLACRTQTFEQRTCAVIEILSELAQGTLGHFIDRKLTCEVSADADKFDQCLNIRNLVGIEY